MYSYVCVFVSNSLEKYFKIINFQCIQKVLSKALFDVCVRERERLCVCA